MNSFTPNYNLDLYDLDDKPNLNDQYNDAMNKIDNQLKNQANDLITAETAVNNLSQKVDTFNDRITENTNNIQTNTSDILTNKTDIEQLKTDVTTAQATAENGVQAAHEANELAVQASSAAQTAQTTADQAKTSIAQEAATRANADTNLQSQINSIIETGTGAGIGTEAMRKAKIVTIGDSYAQAENSINTWPHQIKNILGNQATIYNAAVSGGGFTTDITFENQIVQQANKMTQQQRDQVNYVIIAGGRNDIGSQATSALTNASSRAVTAAATNFKNSTILVVPMLWDNGPAQSIYDYIKADCYDRGAVQSNVPNIVIPVNWAWTWLKGLGNVLQSDGIHPNNLGALRIARYMLAAINGSYSGRTSEMSWSGNDFEMQFTCSGGTVNCRIAANNSTSFPTGGIANAIPIGARPYADVSTVGYTNSGTSTGIYQFTRGGVLNIYGKSGALGGCQGNTSWAW